MRKIETVTGEVFSGRNSKFVDKGDHIEQRNMFATTKIYKDNIVTDRQNNAETLAAVATTVAVAVATGGSIIL